MTLARLVGLDENKGRILGIDASSDMIAKAVALSRTASHAQLSGARINFVVLDGHDGLPVSEHGKFDKVFSNAALHWMKTDPSKVLSNVYKALTPIGRFAAELGGFMNCVGVRGQLHASLRARGLNPELLDPWYFPTPAEYSALLQEQGFKVESCELVPRITPLPATTGIKGWLMTFAGPFLNALADEQSREAVVQEVENALRPDCYDAKLDQWSVMYVRLRVLAFRID